MATLQSILLSPQKRSAVVDDCAQLIDEEVGNKGGLSGMALKAAYMVVKKIKPGMINEAVDRLLDEFVTQLEPFYQAFLQSGSTDLAAYLRGRSSEVASGLLGVTDGRIARADNGTIKGVYDKLRPTAAKHVEASVPGMARVLARHTAA